MDITADTVKIAIVLNTTTPAPGDYITAEWTRTPPAGTVADYSRQSIEYRYFKVSGTADGATDSAWARIVVGTDIVLAAAGVYNCWVKVVDSPETPAKLAGTMTVT